MIPKPKRQVDKRYLEYIKTLPCLCKSSECLGDIAPHHTSTKGAGGSDYLTVPLCGKHHNEARWMGIKTFQRLHSLGFQSIIINQLIGYIALSKLKEG